MQLHGRRAKGFGHPAQVATFWALWPLASTKILYICFIYHFIIPLFHIPHSLWCINTKQLVIVELCYRSTYAINIELNIIADIKWWVVSKIILIWLFKYWHQSKWCVVCVECWPVNVDWIHQRLMIKKWLGISLI